jgi:hypothetical protein
MAKHKVKIESIRDNLRLRWFKGKSYYPILVQAVTLTGVATTS